MLHCLHVERCWGRGDVVAVGFGTEWDLWWVWEGCGKDIFPLSLAWHSAATAPCLPPTHRHSSIGSAVLLECRSHVFLCEYIPSPQGLALLPCYPIQFPSGAGSSRASRLCVSLADCTGKVSLSESKHMHVAFSVSPSCPLRFSSTTGASCSLPSTRCCTRPVGRECMCWGRGVPSVSESAPTAAKGEGKRLHLAVSCWEIPQLEGIPEK